jgi:hypothetical protein
MSEQDLRELAEKLGSRAVARYGELTAKRRQAEEQLNALKQELVKRDTQKDPLETKKIENNPFGDIDTVEKLQAKAKEVDEAIEWAEDILWHNEHLGAEDIVATIDGKDYTKAQVRKVMRDSQKARKDFLPAQLAEVNARQNRVAVKQQFSEAIKTELNWMQGDDNDVRKQYEILKESPLLKKAMESVPDLEPTWNTWWPTQQTRFTGAGPLSSQSRLRVLILLRCRQAAQPRASSLRHAPSRP